MNGFSLTTLGLAAMAGAAGIAGFPMAWVIVNGALAATLLGIGLARAKFSGIDLVRTLKITLAALVANAVVAAIAVYAGSALRGLLGIWA